MLNLLNCVNLLRLRHWLKTDTEIKQMLNVGSVEDYRVDWYRFDEGHQVLVAYTHGITVLSIELRNNGLVLCPWLGNFLELDFGDCPDPFRQATGIGEVFQDHCSYGNPFSMESASGFPEMYLSIPLPGFVVSRAQVLKTLSGLKDEIAQKVAGEIRNYINEQKDQRSILEEIVMEDSEPYDDE
ncbi:hypothetical protein ACQ4M3_09385 [Leptolyngbya sp. AN03gr2]|uniref:hypothetical protein n=1 Tax=Leptolyngbya sp. AN03gr2 TaxID=3423364 RepID=UPI003D31398B